MSHQGSQLASVLESLDLDQCRPDGLGAPLFDLGLIHAGGIVVANLLGDRVPVLRDGSLLENSAQILQIVFVELAVNAPRGLVRGDGIVLLPAPAGILVEVDTGVRRAIHGADVQAGRVSQSGLDVHLGCGGNGGGIIAPGRGLLGERDRGKHVE